MTGAIICQGTSAYSTYLLSLGLGLHTSGWLIIPANGNRRSIAVVPAALASCALLFGPAGGFLLIVPLAAWLFVRQRPALSYVVIVIPLVSAAILSTLFVHYGFGVVIATVSVIALIGSAWLAWLIAASQPG